MAGRAYQEIHFVCIYIPWRPSTGDLVRAKREKRRLVNIRTCIICLFIKIKIRGCLEYDTYVFNTVYVFFLHSIHQHIYQVRFFFHVFFLLPPRLFVKKMKIRYYTMSTSGRQLHAAFLTAIFDSYLLFLYMNMMDISSSSAVGS